MKLIEKIEVNYLRSLYGATLDRVGDLNVIFGRNDSGKSNLLRALNLFFNEMTEPDRGLEFDLDMSDTRKQEARDAKGRQFIWIKITFNVPENYQGALGEQIAIKRQWNRDGDVTETIFPALETAGQQARLTRLLNDIDFTYIPAIKDLNVYADLIERMYGAAAETDALRDATTRFVSAIERQTTSLSTQLAVLFNGPARLAPPTEMSRLFRSLDFAHGEEGHSLLRQKGDGVKARHLPELLRFINERDARKRIFLWGFEEPENSLDLGAADAEAQRFANFAKRGDTQIFITSHSPAFYLADSEQADVRRFFITKQEKSESGEMAPKNASSLIDNMEEAERKMEQAGLLQLPFVIRQLGEQKRVLREKEAEAEQLRRELENLRKPTLFVEGRHDVSMFSAALNRLEIEDQIIVKPLGGTPQSVDALLSAVLQQGGLNAGAAVLFLFDDDKAGRGAFKKLCKASSVAQPSKYGDNTQAWCLPWTEDFRRFTRRVGIQHDQAFFTAEFLYPAEEAASLCYELLAAEAGDELKEWSETINGDYWPGLGQAKCNRLFSAEAGTVDWFFARGVPDSLKVRFHVSATNNDLATDEIDRVAEVVLESLLGN